MSYTVKTLLPAKVIHDAGREDSPEEKVNIVGFDVIDTSVLAMTVEDAAGNMQQFPLWPTVRISTRYGKQQTGDQLLAELVKAEKVNMIQPPKPRQEFHQPPLEPVKLVKLRKWEVYALTFVIMFFIWEIVRHAL
ncbi:hypothetical protein BVC71_09025 [Marivivens niveibacter]|uniref:Uncharacterized protein n=1 Tax=Marivivens niveibacter TaxID=1930667 RepID=A0A251WXJ3_9RHOB|nr:hypothetical protein [Marivivens niveibacter]OUD08855.1 hypothetical protein BVC71_09025 [Marivivens niveibacter]